MCNAPTGEDGMRALCRYLDRLCRTRSWCLTPGCRDPEWCTWHSYSRMVLLRNPYYTEGYEE